MQLWHLHLNLDCISLNITQVTVAASLNKTLQIISNAYFDSKYVYTHYECGIILAIFRRQYFFSALSSKFSSMKLKSILCRVFTIAHQIRCFILSGSHSHQIHQQLIVHYFLPLCLTPPRFLFLFGLCDASFWVVEKGDTWLMFLFCPTPTVTLILCEVKLFLIELSVCVLLSIYLFEIMLCFESVLLWLIFKFILLTTSINIRIYNMVGEFII